MKKGLLIIIVGLLLIPRLAMARADTMMLSQKQFVVVSIDDALYRSIGNDTLILSKSDVAVSKNKHLKEKLLAGFLSFPFPIGFLGAHRILLGTKPWVPIVYVATFGGCFGLLPLVDFCVIMFSDDVTKYENNPNIFMWVK